MQPSNVLIDALVRQLLAMREMADGALHTISALKASGVPVSPEVAESALKKIKTFEGEHEVPPA